MMFTAYSSRMLVGWRDVPPDQADMGPDGKPATRIGST
jgi:hypothetical protein